jgi:hypothetical protein
VSALELLHPTGSVERVLIAGEGCPASLLPHAVERAASDVGLAVIAPAATQLAQRGWLARALADAATALAADGVVYALLPPAVRRTASRRLRASGLELAPALAQLSPRAARYLVPLRARPWRHMLEQEVGAHPRLRRGLSAVAAAPLGTALLAELLPGAAIVARREPAAPLAAWLERLDGDTRATADVATLTSWRGAAGSVVLFCFANGENRPWGVAKAAPEAHAEARRLDRLGAGARAAGAAVPRPLATGSAGPRQVLVESPVPGPSAARVLMGAPARFPEVAVAVAAWLERWNAATARRATPATGWLEREAAALELPAAYRTWLADRCAALAGTPLPVVAAHHDLTMWNVRLGDDGAFGVLDWAEAEDEALPLADLLYAVADAAAACDGYRDRVAAVRACFEPGGERAAMAAPLVERLTASLAIPPDAAELCFHACWIRHAANERRAGAAKRPFVEIVRWLAHRGGAS